VAKASVRAEAASLLEGAADPDGRGLLLRGLEYQPLARANVDPRLLEVLLRLARLAESAGRDLCQHPDSRVRRSAAVLAARAHPLRAAFDA
jgi:hypothetical protein